MSTRFGTFWQTPLCWLTVQYVYYQRQVTKNHNFAYFYPACLLWATSHVSLHFYYNMLFFYLAVPVNFMPRFLQFRTFSWQFLHYSKPGHVWPQLQNRKRGILFRIEDQTPSWILFLEDEATICQAGLRTKWPSTLVILIRISSCKNKKLKIRRHVIPVQWGTSASWSSGFWMVTFLPRHNGCLLSKIKLYVTFESQ
jgi:hypothetical protein